MHECSVSFSGDSPGVFTDQCDPVDSWDRLPVVAGGAPSGEQGRIQTGAVEGVYLAGRGRVRVSGQ